MQRLFDKKSPSDPCSDLNELERTKLFLSRYDPNDRPCQRCGKTCWACKKTASYSRRFVWPKNGKPASDRITIPVYLCEKCGKDELSTGTANGDYHHAILPGNIIPFSSFTLSFVLAVLYAYVHRTDTVQKKIFIRISCQGRILIVRSITAVEKAETRRYSLCKEHRPAREKL